jgi:hypothetical protein
MTKSRNLRCPQSFTLAQRLAYYTGAALANGCRPWTGYKDPDGYGHLFWKRQARIASQLVLENKLGRPLMSGMETRHTCDHTWCVEPSHVIEGTPKQNVEDCIVRGRRARTHGEANSRALLNENQVHRIITLKGKVPQRILAARYNVSRATISHIHSGRNWKYITGEDT